MVTVREVKGKSDIKKFVAYHVNYLKMWKLMKNWKISKKILPNR